MVIVGTLHAVAVRLYLVHWIKLCGLMPQTSRVSSTISVFFSVYSSTNSLHAQIKESGLMYFLLLRPC